MNDDAAEPIKKAAAQVEDPEAGEKSEEREEDQKLKQEERDYRDPNIYWFESTAIPLLAGTFGPIASAFNICALSSSWRYYLPTGTSPNNGTVIDDPKWCALTLLALNGVSLASALIANGALLLNMARRLEFVIAQPITIVGFFLSWGLLMADLIAITASSTLQLPASSPAAPAVHHALTSAFYYAIMAAVIYFLIAILMCWTVWGVYRGHFGREFSLTVAQRTLMLQTMSFVTYLLLGALIFSHIEGWRFLNAVYWADITLLTVGLGDYSPQAHTGRSLLFPFAIGGIVIVGLVIGSIRTLFLERGQKKISARMMEKKRLRAIQSVDTKKHRIRVSRFQTIPFKESFTNGAQKREQEFHVMRSVQNCAERDRKWMALLISTFMALVLWLVGAVIFWVAERSHQNWSYFEALYFSYVCLLTIGYGTPSPISPSSRAFFVLWSLLAIPALTILISDMGDTVVQMISSATIWIGSLTVLPGEGGFRATAKQTLQQLPISKLNPKEFESSQPPGFIPASENHKSEGQMRGNQDHEAILDRIADRLATHLEKEELQQAADAQEGGDSIDRDIYFYHFVLARECQKLLKDMNASPPREYGWGEWEYFLKLMANNCDARLLGGRELVPEALRMAETKKAWEKKQQQHRWSWLSDKSPLMGHQTETEWILERLSMCLEMELKDSKMLAGKSRQRVSPPISISEMLQRIRYRGKAGDKDGTGRPISGDGTSESGDEIERRIEQGFTGNSGGQRRKDE